jgi:hypothetical protein
MTAKDNTYKFSHKGKEYEVPALKAIPTGVMRKTRKIEDDADKSFTILEMLLGEDSPEIAAIDTMTTEEFTAWLTGWTSGAPLGEV